MIVISHAKPVVKHRVQVQHIIVHLPNQPFLASARKDSVQRVQTDHGHVLFTGAGGEAGAVAGGAG